MSDTNKNVLITKIARSKLVRARAGDLVLPKVVGFAFGDGGVDSAGTIIPPVEGQTKLYHEIFRKEIDGYEVLTTADATVRYSCTLSEDELAGNEISEIGLYDEDGDIVGMKTFARKGKDDDVEQTYTLNDIF